MKTIFRTIGPVLATFAAAGPVSGQPVDPPPEAVAPEAVTEQTADESINLEFAVGLDCIGSPESDPAERAIAAYWFEQGLSQIDREAYDEALRSFACSYAFIPHAATLYNLAHAADWAGEPETALRAYRLYLERAPNAENRPDVEADVLRIVTALESGTPVGTVQASMETLMVRPTQEVEEPSVGQAVTGWSCVGLGVVGAIVGSVFAGLAARERSAIDDAASGAQWSSYDDNEARIWDYDLATALGFGVGGAAALAGILLLVLDDSGEEQTFTLAPALGDGATGLVLRGVF